MEFRQYEKLLVIIYWFYLVGLYMIRSISDISISVNDVNLKIAWNPPIYPFIPNKVYTKSHAAAEQPESHGSNGVIKKKVSAKKNNSHDLNTVSHTLFAIEKIAAHSNVLCVCVFILFVARFLSTKETISSDCFHFFFSWLRQQMNN